MKSYKKILLIILVLLIVGFILSTFNGTTTKIASDDVGDVSKTTYLNPASNITIVVITGIHPRETLAIEPEKEACQKIASDLHVNVINYDVKVTKDANDYKNSRHNGEYLVSKYVVPDINKTDANVVIISHSHIEGYGEGFYVATPEMDEASVTLAQKIRDGNIDFNYFPKTGNETYNSTSAVLVSKPLAQSGYPTLVYEIPENITKDDSTNKTYTLMKKIVDILG